MCFLMCDEGFESFCGSEFCVVCWKFFVSEYVECVYEVVFEVVVNVVVVE